MRSHFFFILLLIGSQVCAQQLENPIISVPSGYYTSDVTVSISHPEPGVTLFYTINGSDPNPLSPVYSGPVTLSSRVGEANNFAMIPTNPSFTYPVGDYTESRANNRGWLEPNGEVFKINVLRVRAYKAGFVPSDIVTETIIVDPSGAGIYNYPVMSFVMDSIDLFSNSSGIYVYGNNANYTQKGAAWERIANMEYFDENGNLVIDQKVRTRIHGGGSRHSTKKTFRVYAEYDTINNFKYPFFDNYQLDKFKRILIRSGGHRPDCYPRDDLANLITEGLNVDQQHAKNIILFLNGEYWGIHTIKERVDPYFFQNQYGIDDDDISILDQEYDLQGGGHAADSLEMVAIETRADTSDMNNPENYYWIADRIDIENYIDYMAGEIFLSNQDWVYSNVVLWKKNGGYDPTLGPGQDGKFRWCFYDFDGAFGGSCDNAYYTVNTLEDATVSSGIYAPYSRLFRGLLESPIFREQWINRTCDLLNSHFKADVVKEKMNQMYAMITPEMPENVNRWRYPSEASTLADRASETPSLIQWDTTFYYLRRFADRRPKRIRDHILDHWTLPDSSYLTVDVNDQSMGTVQVNSIHINENLPGIETGIYPWTGIYIDSVTSRLIARPLPGYEFVEWLESGNTNDTIYWTPDEDSIFTAVFQPSSAYQNVVINEVMPSNSMYLADNFGDFDDWTELYNPNPFPVDISNWKMQRDTIIWTIPEGTVIAGNGYHLFWKDNELFQGDDHANFKLPNSTNTLKLLSPNLIIQDEIIYPQTPTNNSFGRYPNGSATFSSFTYPTPRQNNDISTLEEIEPIELLVYPNPANNELWLSQSSSGTIYSIDGQGLLYFEAAKMIDVSSLSNGTYLIQTAEGTTSKFVIAK